MGKSAVFTLWRDDMFMANAETTALNLGAPLIAATSDNPAASAEARAAHRQRVIAIALVGGQPLATAALIAIGALATRHSSSDSAMEPYWIGAFVVDLSLLLGGLQLQSSSYAHADKAIDIYNANPPPGCGPPARGSDAP